MTMWFALLIFLLTGSGIQGPPSAPIPTLLQAQQRLQANDAAGARTILEQIVAASPANARAWRLLGITRRQLNDIDGSMAALKKVLELQPGNAQAFLDLGVTCAAGKNVEAAFEWLAKARASRQVDMTQMEGVAALDPLRADPRFAALVPVPADFANPFVEPVAILREWRGEASNDQFGWIARNIGDADGDRIADVVTSAPSNNAGGVGAGRIYVYSSKGGVLLWTADGGANDGLGSGLEAAGDVNRDGAGDVIASAPGAGYAKVYSGRDGKVLLTLTSSQPGEAFGQHTQGIGDVNGDGIPDLLVGAPGLPRAPAGFEGRAYVFSGKDGALLSTLKGERAGDRFGSAVTGHQAGRSVIFAVGAPGAGPTHTGRVYVYRALGAAPAFVVESDATGGALAAMFLSVPGDLNRDGVEDIYSSDWANSANGPSTGRVYVHSGKDGRKLFEITGETAGEGFGTSASNAGDVDGDGTGDLIVGAWQYAGAAASGGRVSLYSGKDGRLLKRYTCRIPGDTLGFDAVGLGDIDGDRTIDLLVTSAWSGVNGFHSGRVFVISSGVKR